MNTTDQRIARILQGAGLLNDGQLRAIDKWQQQWGGKVHQIAVDQGFADEAQVAAALARGLSMPRVELATTTIEADALATLDRNFCEENAVIPVALRDNGASLWAAVSDPTDVGLLDRVRTRARVARVMPGVAGFHEIIAAVRQHYGGVALGVDSNYGIELNSADDEEFKVTNIAGGTMVKHVAGVEQLRNDLRAAPADDPAAVYTAAAAGASQSSPQLMAVDRARLDAIKNDLQQSNRALAAIVELCARHGVFSDDELAMYNKP